MHATIRTTIIFKEKTPKMKGYACYTQDNNNFK